MRRLFEVIADLKRRKVFQVASIYLVTGWGAALGASELLPNFGAPDWIVRSIVIGMLVLFPVVVVLAWYYELTRQGIVRDPMDSVPRSAQHSSAGPVASPAVPCLEVRWEDQGIQRTSTFNATFTAGRDAACEVSTLDPIASRSHARFEPESRGWLLVDLGSSNGTLLDGIPVRRQMLPAKCSVQLGSGGQRLDLRVLDRTAETAILGGVK